MTGERTVSIESRCHRRQVAGIPYRYLYGMDTGFYEVC